MDDGEWQRKARVASKLADWARERGRHRLADRFDRRLFYLCDLSLWQAGMIP
jgi:hypothetical protein